MAEVKIPEGYEQQTWVCIGRRVLEGGTPGYGFQLLRDGKLTGDPFYFSKIKGFYPGGTYKVVSKPDQTSAKIGSKEYVGDWENAEDILTWDINDQEAMTKIRMRQLEKKNAAHDVIADALKPIARLYQKTDSAGRRAIDAIVLDTLRRSSYGL